MKLSEMLAAKGIALPALSGPFGAYVPVKRAGGLIFVSGQLPMKDGKLMAVGQVPSRCAVDAAKAGARQCVINALAAVAAVEGSVDVVKTVIRVGAFVSSDSTFTEQPKVANGASEFLLELLGDDGKHVRAAVGVNTLPLDAAVEVEFLFARNGTEGHGRRIGNGLVKKEMIRPATVYDVAEVQRLINSHAELGKMLFKSLAQLYEDLRDFAVYEEDGKVVGCVALTIIWADLAEIRSLAVDDGFQGRGIGRKLVEWTAEEARRLHIRKIMSLTYEQKFFEKLGYVVVDKDTLPLKVWSDCVRCPKRDGCDEIAMVKTLEDVPVVEVAAAAPTPRGVSIPVLEGEE